MKVFGMAVGLAALFAAGTASAVPAHELFSTLTGASASSDFRNFKVAKPSAGVAGSPDGDQFNVPSNTVVTSVSLRLTDATASTDGGSIIVYLVPDQSGTPFTSGITLATSGRITLGTILDSSLPTSLSGCSISACNTTLSGLNATVTAGTWWLVAISASDTGNGGPGTTGTSALWWVNGDGVGDFTTGLFNEHVNTSGAAVSSANATAQSTFEAQVNAPEPASIALLGAGLVGLGLRRRRKQAASSN